MLFMITHDANFNTAVQALILIYQVATAKQVCPLLTRSLISDRVRSLLSNVVRIITRPTIGDILEASTLPKSPIQIP